MKRIWLTFFLCGLIFISNAQDESVEISSTGIQMGFIGVWVHNEARLTNQLVLRSELGLERENLPRAIVDGRALFIWLPVVTLEPKWYYNLHKRSSKAKSIAGNSGNFISLKYSLYPDWFVISRFGNIGGYTRISIIPTWGIRRNIGNHFNYEAGIGLGFRYIFGRSTIYTTNSEIQAEGIANLHLRIGYRF